MRLMPKRAISALKIQPTPRSTVNADAIPIIHFIF
jgi:hypothetical protein